MHLTGELSPGPRIIVYEYQKTRHSGHPKEYYKDFRGILMTDGLEQYHKLARDQEGITNANCMAHARRHFANAICILRVNRSVFTDKLITCHGDLDQ